MYRTGHRELIQKPMYGKPVNILMCLFYYDVKPIIYWNIKNNGLTSPSSNQSIGG